MASISKGDSGPTHKRNPGSASPRPPQAAQLRASLAPGAAQPLQSDVLPKQMRLATRPGLLAPGLRAQAQHRHDYIASKLELTGIQPAEPGLSAGPQGHQRTDRLPTGRLVRTQQSRVTALSRKKGEKTHKTVVQVFVFFFKLFCKSMYSQTGSASLRQSMSNGSY